MKRTFKKIKDPRIEAKLQKILSEPVGTPIDLTREEAKAIVEAGIGGRPDLPSGEEYVRQVSEMMWGDLASRD
jgi:hypothetical protein